jgi:hypothetical protein
VQVNSELCCVSHLVSEKRDQGSWTPKNGGADPSVCFLGSSEENFWKRKVHQGYGECGSL